MNKNVDINILTEDQGGNNVLFKILVDDAEYLKSEETSFKGTPSKTAKLGSGIPDITNIIIVLGSSGAFAALTQVLIHYFKKRPVGFVEFERITKGETVTVKFTASNCSAEEVSKAIKPLLKD